MRVPLELTSSIRTFCQSLTGSDDAVLVDIEPVEEAEVLDCFAVVERAVAARGGDAVLGWRLWENPSFWLEAEFHAIWRQADGRLVDVTPAQGGVERTLFIADPNASYDGRQINNRFWPLSAHPAVARYVAAQAAWFEFMNRGSRADEYEIRIRGAERAELEEIELRMRTSLLELEAARNYVAGRNEPCPCGSGRKYKRCCIDA